MNCRRTQKLLSQSKDSRNGASDAPAIAAHVNACEVCQSFARSLEMVSQTLSSAIAPATVPKGLANALAKAALQAPPGSASWLPDFARLALPTAALGIAVAALLLLLGSSTHSSAALASTPDVVHASMGYGEVLTSTLDWGGEDWGGEAP